jgi:acyl-CoA thioesterase-1
LIHFGRFRPTLYHQAAFGRPGALCTQLLAGLLVIAGVASCGGSDHARPGAGTSLLVLGDSLSAGYRLPDPDSQAWPALLEAQWHQEGFLAPDQHVVNASVSGSTSTEGLARLPDLLAEHHPATVAVALGSNDLRRGQVGALAGRVEKLVDLAEGAGARVVIIGVELPTALALAARGQPNDTLDQVAQDHGVARADIPLDRLMRKNLMLDDNIHPSAGAQPLIAQALDSTLRDAMSP